MARRQSSILNTKDKLYFKVTTKHTICKLIELIPQKLNVIVLQKNTIKTVVIKLEYTQQCTVATVSSK